MKKILLTLIALVLTSASVFAQTPAEIINKMDEVMQQHDTKSGLAMTMEMKIFIIGTVSSRVMTYGDKIRVEAGAGDKHIISWIDGDTEHEYNVEEKVIKIKRRDTSKPSKEKENMGMFKSATEGYDVTLTKETDDAWYFHCKKSRSNPKRTIPRIWTLSSPRAPICPRA